MKDIIKKFKEKSLIRDIDKEIYNLYKINDSTQAKTPIKKSFPIKKPSFGFSLTSISSNNSLYNTGDKRSELYGILNLMIFIDSFINEKKLENQKNIEKEFQKHLEENFQKFNFKEFTYFASNEDNFYAIASLENSILIKYTEEIFRNEKEIFEQINKELKKKIPKKYEKLNEEEIISYKFQKILKILEDYKNSSIEKEIEKIKELLNKEDNLEKGDIAFLKKTNKKILEIIYRKKISTYLISILSEENFDKIFKGIIYKSQNLLLSNSSQNIDIYLNSSGYFIKNSLPKNNLKKEKIIIYKLDKSFKEENDKYFLFIFNVFYKNFLSKEDLEIIKSYINGISVLNELKETQKDSLNRKLKITLTSLINFINTKFIYFNKNILEKNYSKDILNKINLIPEKQIPFLLEVANVDKNTADLLNLNSINLIFNKEWREK